MIIIGIIFLLGFIAIISLITFFLEIKEGNIADFSRWKIRFIKSYS